MKFRLFLTYFPFKGKVDYIRVCVPNNVWNS